jgi:ferric-dicitrate binding protein FerR (iron transport regulator)
VLKLRDTLNFTEVSSERADYGRKTQVLSPNGSPYKIRLSDKTLVWMNASSRIIFPNKFSKEHRTVEIQGEAYFDIAKKENCPFIVKVGRYNVEAVGTNFLIRSYDHEDSSVITLIKGKLKVKRSDVEVPARMMNAKEQYITNGKSERLINCKNPEAEIDAWRKASFNLNKDLKTVLADVGRWYGVEVSYQSDIENIELSGQLQRTIPLSRVVIYLKEVAKINIRYTKGKIIVSSN